MTETVTFYLACIHCGKAYDLSEEAKQLFLKTRNALNRLDKSLKCCDKPNHFMNVPRKTLEVDELRKLLRKRRR